ncbi:expressed unknown protein [Seminavis robusta]|uniref:Uncharacterized protein n=1 Tax=Seminavis robusta TaxID=568900 RepID=A0A9N8HQL4_9STRA|nr:expressed unknown protein [Seminavis robusta]|eukprot:Sro1205_g252240.1 n/a (749) ;mRNA; r:1308-3705
MATLGGSTRSNGPHVAALPPAEANANSDGVIKDSFDKKMRLLPFCMCEQALTFTGPSDALGVEWANSKSALAVGTMKFLARTVHSGVIEDRAHNQCADHYVTTFFMYAFLMKLPHLITPNIKVIGVTGIRSINALVSLCTQFEETENNELHWERKEVGPEKFEPVGFKSKEPSRNALVGECIADAMEYFEALCHGDTAKVNELKPKLISLLQNISNICNDLNPKPMVPAKVKKQDTNPIAHKGALTIDILHWEGETNGRKLWIPEIPLRQTVLAEQRVDAWRDQRGDTQLALFCLSFPGKPLHTFLCRFMCASLNSVEEVERKAEEIMAAVDATTRKRFINFVKKATHCLGSTPQSFLGNGNNNEDQAESIRIFLESAAGPPQVVDLTEDTPADPSDEAMPDAAETARNEALSQPEAGAPEDDLKAKLQAMKNERNEALSRLGKAQQELQTASASQDDLKSKLQSTEHERNEARSQLALARQQLKEYRSLQEELTRSKDREKSLMAQVDAVVRALDTGERSLDTCERALNTGEKALRDSQEQLRDSQEAKDRLKAELSNSKKENECLAQHLMKMTKINKMRAAKEADTRQDESTEMEAQATTTQEMSTAAAPGVGTCTVQQSVATVPKEGVGQKMKRDATKDHSKSQEDGKDNNPQHPKKQRRESSVTLGEASGPSPSTNRGTTFIGAVRVKCESVPASSPGDDPEVLNTASPGTNRDTSFIRAVRVKCESPVDDPEVMNTAVVEKEG